MPGVPDLRVPAGTRPFGARHADGVLAALAGAQREIAAAAARVAHKVVHGRAWVRSGCASLEAFAAERLGVSARTLRRRAALGRGLAWHRALERAFFGEDGGAPLGELAASVVASVACPADLRGWIEIARSTSVETLSRLARRAREAGRPGVPEQTQATQSATARPARSVRRVPLADDTARLDLRGALVVLGRADTLVPAARSGQRDDVLAEVRELVRMDVELTCAVALTLARVDAAGGWPMIGYRGVAPYAADRLGLPKSTAHDLLALGRALDGSRLLHECVLGGTVSVRDVVRAVRRTGGRISRCAVEDLVLGKPDRRRDGAKDRLPERCAWLQEEPRGGRGQLPDHPAGV